ncbi:ATPase with chaperone activity [Piscinibacter sakaiensis]|uniref:ATPase with chaperone activity n=1 Tax=Piscinibacter sakaiensis TaxID=1547922 RepID=UPI003AAD58BE
MTDDNQIDIPPSFVALYLEPGRIKPNASRQQIGERYEFCEDLAAMLTDTARTMLFDLGITEDDVLERCHRGLLVEASGVSVAEAGWVVCRLAELLGWPLWLPEPAALNADRGD